MKLKVTNILFYIGLFTINAFRHNWDGIIIPTAIVGIPASLYFGSAWHIIPSFIGSYLACIHDEYVKYKNVTNEQDN
jgi:hypothetical protein